MYEAGFRGYDPQIGRFWQPDPIGELFEAWSPYNYAFANPIVFNDPLGLDGEQAVNDVDDENSDFGATGDNDLTKHKPKPKPPKPGPGPLHETLAPVVVIGYRKPAKKDAATVTADPPDKAPRLLFLHGFADYDDRDRKEWEKDQTLFHQRWTTGQLIVQGGESQHYLDALAMYVRWAKAEHEGRVMQVVSVATILAPAAGVELGWSVTLPSTEEIGQWWFETNLRTWFIGQSLLNSAVGRTVGTIIATLGSRLTAQQIAKLNAIANKYYDLNETIDNIKDIKDFVEAVNDVLEGIGEK